MCAGAGTGYVKQLAMEALISLPGVAALTMIMQLSSTAALFCLLAILCGLQLFFRMRCAPSHQHCTLHLESQSVYQALCAEPFNS